MEWSTTSAILAGLRDFADHDTWELFVARFRPAIIGFARRMGLSEAEAEDAAQASLLHFVEGYRAGRYDRGKGALAKWLFTIAYRRVMDVVREPGRHRELAVAGADSDGVRLVDPVDPSVPKSVWDRAWEAALVEQCLRKVRADVHANTWRAFAGIVLEERPAEEVGRELGMTRGAVFVAKYRVLQRLKALRVEFEDAGL